jgi:hypothetical protein
MKPSVYIETTIPSFLVGEVSEIVLTAGRQFATRRWWREEREKYRLFVSQAVQFEVARGQTELAKLRTALIEDLPRLQIKPEIIALARDLHSYLRLPPAAETDALHLAVACYYETDYLLTWNMKHLANGHVRRKIEQFGSLRGMPIPVICTPEELAGWSDGSEVL